MTNLERRFITARRAAITADFQKLNPRQQEGVLTTEGPLLLLAGAGSVACVDVNYGQLAWKLRQDPRVAVFERTNIKLADPVELGAPFDLLVADLSFIGLAALAPTFARFAQAGTIFIGLIKPQFESQHDETDHGIVRDEAVRLRTVDEVRAALEAAGFECTGVTESPITGHEGNVEYLVRAVFQG